MALINNIWNIIHTMEFVYDINGYVQAMNALAYYGSMDFIVFGYIT